MTQASEQLLTQADIDCEIRAISKAYEAGGRQESQPFVDHPPHGRRVLLHPKNDLRHSDPETIEKRLAESGERWGVAAICIGVGQALAVVLENESTR